MFVNKVLKVSFLKACVAGLVSTLLLPIAVCNTAFAAASVPPAPSMIRIENKLTGISDVVTVTGLSAGDIVKVYTDGGTVTPIGTATVGSGSNSVAISINQLGVTAGYVYVTVTQPTYSESRRIVKSYLAEPLSVAPAASAIRITNHSAGTSDTVALLGLQAGDVAKVYADASKNTFLGSATAVTGTAEGTIISIGQLGSAEGVVYVTVTELGKRESRVTEKGYAGEAMSAKPKLAQIRVMNELSGAHDHVIVSGLQAGDILKVYASEKAASALTQAAVAPGSDTADASLPQLGVGEGTVYVTVTSSPLQESERVAKQFPSEPVTAAPSPGTIVVTNEPVGTDDRIELSGLAAGDIVKVYADASSTTVIGSATADGSSTQVKVSVSQLGRQAGYVYVTVTSYLRGESRRVIKAFAAELASGAPDRSDIQIHNAVGSEDTVTVNSLQAGDTVKVYADDISAAAIGSATASDDGSSVVVHAALPGTGYGVIYVTVTRKQEEESARTAKIYPAEPVTLPLSPNQLRISNLTGAYGNDEVTAIAIKPGDTIKLYADAVIATPMQTVTGIEASASAALGTTTATIGSLQLNGNGGRLYVTVTSQGKRESSRIVKVYEAE
ncbi:hypothetical protein SAMN03159341_108236 [Paenibacillus sp. 1_12]|uniref:hypothetical protein n=1 Tax=Paenibacillus sp. 1_12 TaxID=1566278 RepID=UPI0008E92021|nr:hypothetical protein [Paenibacillus sp. 1_12]SFL69066.1 hypothetical protein SAMN03159341_108236 [Paenibacillus sp. 1_12]